MDAFPIPVSILTGFLGAGKTTLLNRLLKDPALTDTAVIVNEFGEVAIDHLLVETAASEGIVELSGGCLCCTVRGDLVDTLCELVERVQTGRTARLRRIVVETTGLADPAGVLQAVMAHPVLVQALRLDGVVTVVDALDAAGTLAAHSQAAAQVAVADRLVLTKSGLAGAAPRGKIEAALRALNPNAPILDAGEDAAGRADLLECGLHGVRTGSADLSRWMGGAAYEDPAHSRGHGRHGHAHHGSGIRSFSLVHDRPVPYAAVESFLDLLRALHGEGLLRMKGVVELAEDPERPLVLHGVRRLLHPPARLAAWPEGKRGTRLVLIGDGLAEDDIRRLFSAFTGRPEIDAPDRQALVDNPLAIAGMR